MWEGRSPAGGLLTATFPAPVPAPAELRVCACPALDAVRPADGSAGARQLKEKNAGRSQAFSKLWSVSFVQAVRVSQRGGWTGGIQAIDTPPCPSDARNRKRTKRDSQGGRRPTLMKDLLVVEDKDTNRTSGQQPPLLPSPFYRAFPPAFDPCESPFLVTLK